MSLLRRQWKRKLGIIGIGAAAIFLAVDYFGPAPRYRPLCAGDDTYVDGPLRLQFILLLKGLFDRDGVPYTIHGSDIYRGGQGERGWSAAFDYYDFQYNTDPEIAADIAGGVKVEGGGYFPPPERLTKLIEETEPRWGPFPRRTPEGNIIYGGDRRFAEDCELFKAAVLKDVAG